MEDSIASVNDDIDMQSFCEFTIEETEGWLKENCTYVDLDKVNKARAMKLSDLRMIALEHILPKAKKAWLLKVLRREYIRIQFEDGSNIEYIPNTVFNKSENGYYRTITFDMAHIRNNFNNKVSSFKVI